jgi:succinoglycan biosynthesis protein ExoM
MTRRSHISVCVCTYKRPDLLATLLRKLEQQESEDLFEYSVVVVDNDCLESARQIVESFALHSQMRSEYHVEPRQNISLARNRAIENATGDLLAFIDDDEFPGRYWLLSLHRALNEFGADVILGPVKPYFEFEPPQWITRGGFCEREAFPTGTRIYSSKHTRTGNVLLRRSALVDERSAFDPIFGRTGGEDIDFFRKLLQRGSVIAWCNEAHVHETVTPERLKRSYFLRRALLRGVANSERVSLVSFDWFKSLVALILYTVILPILLLWRHDMFMKYLVKDCDHIGKVLACLGLKVVKERA